MSKITAKILITLHDFTIIAAVHDPPSHNAALICQCRSPPPRQGLLSVPVRVFWEDMGLDKGQNQFPEALGTVRRSVKWKAAYWIGDQIPHLAPVLIPTCPALCASGHWHGWAQIWSAPRAAEVLSSNKMLYEAHGSVFFHQPQSQHRLLQRRSLGLLPWWSLRVTPGSSREREGQAGIGEEQKRTVSGSLMAWRHQT